MNDAAQAPTSFSYGADEHGMICGFVLHPRRIGQAIDSAAALQRLQGPAPAGDDSFVWLHFNLSHAGAQPWLRRHAGLDDAYFEALHAGSRSSRIERSGEALFAVVNDVTFDFAFDASDLATLWVAARAGLVISARRHPLRAVDRLRAAVRRGELLASPVALLDHLLGDQADELLRIARAATERIDDIEDALLAGRTVQHGAELARLRRLMVRLQRWLAPEPGALMRMLAHPPDWVSADDTQRLQQASEEFAVVLRDVASLQERIKLLQEEAAARVAEENGRTLFMLTAVTVLALPINLISGLLGMNVGGIPLAERADGFVWVVSLILLVTLVVAILALRRIRRRD